jgi:putative PIN family toxin of toxin-antitoxin system
VGEWLQVAEVDEFSDLFRIGDWLLAPRFTRPSDSTGATINQQMIVRAVVDTNVMVSAIRSPDGLNRRILRACLEGKVQPIMGQTLFLEYEDVMSRDSLFAGTPLKRSERGLLLDAFLSACEWVRVYYLWRPNLRDEGDNHVLELAVAGSADAIVTNNVDDFRGPGLKFPAVRILRPAEAMKELL